MGKTRQIVAAQNPRRGTKLHESIKVKLVTKSLEQLQGLSVLRGLFPLLVSFSGLNPSC